MNHGVIIPNAVRRVIDPTLSTETEGFDVIKNAKVLFYQVGRPNGTRNTQESYITAQVQLAPGRSARLLIVGPSFYLDVFKRYPATLRKNPQVDGYEYEGSNLGAVIRKWSGEPSFISGLIRPLNQNSFAGGNRGRTVAPGGFMPGGNRGRNVNPSNEVTGWQLVELKTAEELQLDLENMLDSEDQLNSAASFMPEFSADPSQTRTRNANTAAPKQAAQPVVNTQAAELLAAMEPADSTQESSEAAQ